MYIWEMPREKRVTQVVQSSGLTTILIGKGRENIGLLGESKWFLGKMNGFLEKNRWERW